MRVRHKRQVLLGAVVSLWLSLGQATYGQSHTLGDPMNTHVRNVYIEAVNALVALSDVAEDFGIPIGVEAAARGQGRKIKIDMSEGTLRDVLDAVIKQDPRYEWTLVNGVVNFTPRSDRDELSAEVLSTTLKEFEVKEGAALIDIKREIIAQPEVHAKLDSAKVGTRIGGFTGRDFNKAGPKFTLRMGNVTVREVLNHLIRTSELKYWVVNRFGDNREIFLLNF